MRTLALAIAAALLLSGCTDDPKPIEPKPSASPSTRAPELPAEASERTSEGQVAFVRHVVSTLNYSANAGSTDSLEPLFDKTCEACVTYMKTIRADNEGQGRIKGFNWRVAKGVVLKGDVVEVLINADQYQKKDPETGEITRVERAKYRLGFKLRTLDDQWIVKELFQPDSSK